MVLKGDFFPAKHFQILLFLFRTKKSLSKIYIIPWRIFFKLTSPLRALWTNFFFLCRGDGSDQALSQAAPMPTPTITIHTHYPCYHQHPSLPTHPLPQPTPTTPATTNTHHCQPTHYGGWQWWVALMGCFNSCWWWVVSVDGSSGWWW